MEGLREIAAGLAAISLVCLIGVVAFYGPSNRPGQAAVVSASDDVVTAVAPTATAEPAATLAPTATSGETPTQVAVQTPTAVPTEVPDAVASADGEPAPAVSPTAPAVPPVAGAGWCVGDRYIDVRLGPADSAEVISQIDAASCGLEQLADAQDGWLAIRFGSGLELVEGWVWQGELTRAG